MVITYKPSTVIVFNFFLGSAAGIWTVGWGVGRERGEGVVELNVSFPQLSSLYNPFKMAG